MTSSKAVGSHKSIPCTPRRELWAMLCGVSQTLTVLRWSRINTISTST